MTSHTVKSGETLTSIARKHGVPLHLLIEVNRITDPNKLKVGQQLLIPNLTTDTTEAQPATPAAPVAPAAPPPIAVDMKTLRLQPSQYIAEEHPKDLIILHFTAGQSAKSAFHTWASNDARVATAYILDVDGKIYEVFDPRFWAFHLGIKGTASANFRHEKRSVGIEIVNVGPLKLRGDKLCWWPGDFTQNWCGVAETAKYVKSSYRGFDHYAAFTEAQYGALGPLLDMICLRTGIGRRLPPVAKRREADAGGFFKGYTGIACHQNYRADKFDTGPALDFSRLGL